MDELLIHDCCKGVRANLSVNTLQVFRSVSKLLLLNIERDLESTCLGLDAATNGHLNLLLYYKIKPNQNIIRAACLGNHVAILEWANIKGQELYSNVWEDALFTEDIDCLKWLNTHVGMSCTGKPMSKTGKISNTALTYLLSTGKLDIIKDVLTNIVNRGCFSSIRYLTTPGICDIKVLDQLFSVVTIRSNVTLITTKDYNWAISAKISNEFKKYIRRSLSAIETGYCRYLTKEKNIEVIIEAIVGNPKLYKTFMSMNSKGITTLLLNVSNMLGDVLCEVEKNRHVTLELFKIMPSKEPDASIIDSAARLGYIDILETIKLDKEPGNVKSCFGDCDSHDDDTWPDSSPERDESGSMKDPTEDMECRASCSTNIAKDTPTDLAVKPLFSLTDNQLKTFSMCGPVLLKDKNKIHTYRDIIGWSAINNVTTLKWCVSKGIIVQPPKGMWNFLIGQGTYTIIYLMDKYPNKMRNHIPSLTNKDALDYWIKQGHDISVYHKSATVQRCDETFKEDPELRIFEKASVFFFRWVQVRNIKLKVSLWDIICIKRLAINVRRWLRHQLE